MASEFVTIAPEFTGMTYDEMMKPVEAMNQAYDTAEQGMYELGANADKWARYAQINPKLGARYDAYMADLQNATGDLMRTGNLANARSSMLRLYRRYQQDVQPIETCATAKAAAVKAHQDKWTASGGTLISEFDPSLVSLDEIYENPDLLDSNRTLSGKDITQRTRDIMNNFAKADLGHMTGEQFNAFLVGMFGPQYAEAVISKGYRPEEAIAELQNGQEGPLYQMVENIVLGPTGITGWSTVRGDVNSTPYQQARSYVKEGFLNGIGEAQRVQVENKDYGLLGRAWLAGQSGSGSSGGNPNDATQPYRWVTMAGPDSKQTQRERTATAESYKYLEDFIKKHPDPSTWDVGHVVTDEEADSVNRFRLAKQFGRSGEFDAASGKTRFPDFDTYTEEQLKWIESNGLKSGSWIGPGEEYKKANDIIRSVTNADFDRNRTTLDNVMGQLKEDSTTRGFTRRAQLNVTDAVAVGNHLVEEIRPYLSNGYNHKPKDLEGMVWEVDWKGKDMKSKTKKVTKDDLIALAGGEYTGIQYDPIQNTFNFQMKDLKDIAVNAELFSNDPELNEVRGYIRTYASDFGNDLESNVKFNDALRYYIGELIHGATDRMYVQGRTSSKIKGDVSQGYGLYGDDGLLGTID